MTTITIITRNGSRTQVDVTDGENLMEVARNVTEEVEAMCGGCLSCATCHVYVDTEFFDRVPPPETAEKELLDFSEHRKPNSRLACQIYLNSSMDGLSATVAPAD